MRAARSEPMRSIGSVVLILIGTAEVAPALAQHSDAAASGADEQLARVCHDVTGSFPPIDRIDQAARPTEPQRGDLGDLRNATQKAAQILRAVCPTGVPRTPAERLEGLQQRVRAMLDAVQTVRPALHGFC